MDYIKSWLLKEENRNSIPELNSILSELQSSQIGIRASNRFTVTYSMLWHVSLLNFLIRKISS